MKRKNIASGAIWEEQIGYSRAIRVGNIIELSGTTSMVNGDVIGKNDPYLQSITNIKKGRSGIKRGWCYHG